MAIEKKWEKIPPTPFVSNGTVDGNVTVSSTAKFKVKQRVHLTASGEPTLILEVKRVNSSTQLIVGPEGRSPTTTTDVSAYTTAKGAAIEAPEQPRPAISQQEHERAVFEEEPTVAKRVFIVDALGEAVDADNPLPVLATVTDNAPQSVFIFRKQYDTADVEVSQIIPNNTKKLYVAVTTLDAKLRLSFTQNGTIDGGTEDYITVHTGNSYYREGLKLSGKTLYFQSNKSNITIEIEAWV